MEVAGKEWVNMKVKFEKQKSIDSVWPMFILQSMCRVKQTVLLMQSVLSSHCTTNTTLSIYFI